MASWLDPRPEGPGCRCATCFGLAEYMLALTGTDYGLAPAPGHAPLPKPAPEPAPTPVRRGTPRQPWQPRPPRSSRIGADFERPAA